MAVYPGKLIILSYGILPILLYSAMYWGAWQNGQVVVHWYVTLSLTTTQIFSILVHHLVVALPILFLCPKVIVFRDRPSVPITVFSLAVFAMYVFAESGYIRLISFAFFVVVMATQGMTRKMLCTAAIIGLSSVAVGGDRFSAVLPVLLLLTTYDLSYKKYFLYGMTILMLLVYVLHPLKTGANPVAFISRSGMEYFWQHLQPIFVSAAYFEQSKISFVQTLIETLPFGKTLFNYDGTVAYLRNDLSLLGVTGDFGSNTAVNGLSASSALALVAAILFKIKLVAVRNGLAIYFVCYSPYFLRRNFADFVNQCLFILFIGGCFLLVKHYARTSFRHRIRTDSP